MFTVRHMKVVSVYLYCESILVLYTLYMYTVPIVTVSTAVSVLGSVLEVATMVME